MPSDSKLSEAVIELLKSLSTDFAHFEKYSDAILAKVRELIPYSMDNYNRGLVSERFRSCCLNLPLSIHKGFTQRLLQYDLLLYKGVNY